jgi:methylated-DNA-[protein]-cysteine S-methyltransferase
VTPLLVRYEAPGWGVGEVWLDDGRVVWSELPTAAARGGASGAHPVAELLRGYFGGERVELGRVELDLDDGFYGECERALRALPRGEVVTYGELAALAGRPGAARAAGTFCARNRLAPFVPCHRVVAAGGLGGYGSLGSAYKRRLLALDGVAL